MRIILVLLTIFLSSCTITNDVEFASFTIGADTFDSSNGTFERSLCFDDKDKIKVSISLRDTDKRKLFELAKLDVLDGNSESDDLEKLCVSSYPYEVSYSDNKGKISTSCFSPLRDDEARVANFIYALKQVKDLPKSNCRFY
ncbi:hypothetical protein QL995_07370 [Pseudoalteromonas sp. APC 3358]|uniref:hypothetical protein n=1 Tax=Pseudoalteromonas sp. APC 3358 TaxID=3035176 RepID=UPI0025B5A15C|nr:hypothetical protein [Pseudoalteromonas sp. APC 3358]MDN3382490.1 hypothetical protein [Pseudoalteromonas sp. APC 3358]